MNAGEFSDDELLGDLFHALSQPLTSLRCAMEVTLLETRSAEQYQQVLRDSLALAEQIAELAGGLRSLLEAGDPVGAEDSASLAACAEEVAEDLRPVAEASGKSLAVAGCACCVAIGIRPLRQALVGLLESAMTACDSGGEIAITTEAHDGDATLRVASPRSSQQQRLDKDCELRRRLALAVCSRILTAHGGRVFVKKDQGRWEAEVRLPGEAGAQSAKFSHFCPCSETGKDLPG